MSDSLNLKIASGLRQIVADMLEEQTIDHETLPMFADRVAGFAAEMEAGLGGPNAGTDAYTMLAAAEQANVEATDTLIQMVAATVLSVLIDEEGGGRSNIDISPFAMDEMMRRYELTATRDGMISSVSIKARPGAFPGLSVSAHTVPATIPMPVSMYRTDDPADSGPAAPQAAVHVYDRPLWVIRYFDKQGTTHFAAMHDQADAIRHQEDYIVPFFERPTIENRFCLHVDCPSDRCNLVQSGRDEEEVTSDA